jgi:ribosomal protein S18 acetylase RimI-like enzyme
MLLAAAEQRLAQREFAEAVLWVFVGNERAARFYRAAGWRRDGAVAEQTFWGMKAQVTRYRRALSAA